MFGTLTVWYRNIRNHQGAPKRMIQLQDAFEVSLNEWFNLPPSLFIHAWTCTGYMSKDAIMRLSGWTEAQLAEAVDVFISKMQSVNFDSKIGIFKLDNCNSEKYIFKFFIDILL